MSSFEINTLLWFDTFDSRGGSIRSQDWFQTYHRAADGKSRSIGSHRERGIFGAIESISKEFQRYLNFEKLCPNAFSVSRTSAVAVGDVSTISRHVDTNPTLRWNLNQIQNSSFFNSGKLWFEFVFHVPQFPLKQVGIIFDEWNMQMKRGKYRALDILPFWIFGQIPGAD